jgi:transcriptional regulator with XRE-family HTH domain
MITSNLRGAVRTARKAAGLTQSELTKRARLSSVSRFNFFEAGYGKLTSEELDRVIKVLNRAEKKRMVPLSNLSCAVPPPEARKAYRVSAGLSQQELGLRMGVPQSLISDFERGKANLTPEHARLWYGEIKAATDEAAAADVIELANRCISGVLPTPDDGENTRLRGQVANLTEQIENLKRQLRNSEALCANQEEISALQHHTIDQLTQRFGEKAHEVVNDLG